MHVRYSVSNFNNENIGKISKIKIVVSDERLVIYIFIRLVFQSLV